MEVVSAPFSREVKSGDEDVILSAVLPLLKLLSLTAIGLVLAHPKTQIVPKSTFKLLANLVFALFLPCTIFIHLGESITLKNFSLWWFIPVNVLLSTAAGCLLGYLVARLCQPPPEFFRFTVIVTAFGNTGNLPLAIVGSVCHDPDNLFGPDCHRTGVSYVSFAQWVPALLAYTLVYHMMEPPMEYYEVTEEETENDIEEQPPEGNASRPLLVEAEWPGMEEKETEHCKTPFIARTFSTIEDSDNPVPVPESIESGTRSPKSVRCMAEPRMVRRIGIVAKQTPIKHILQPPTIATLLAIVIGTVPPIKSFVYDDDAPLSFLLDSLEILAEAMVPSVMLVLGGMLAEGPNDSGLGTRTTVGIIVATLLVLPMIGIGVVRSADKLGLLVPGDEMYRFVLLLQFTTPSAILFGAMASLRGYAVREASSVIFWQHVVALFSVSGWVILYFKLLLSYV
ncbi:hypothetical protein NMG60_11028630 [Bertholletia excelsa]